MKVYVYIPDTDLQELQSCTKLILDVLTRAGTEVMTKDTDVTTAFPDTYQQVQERGFSFLDQMNAIVIEGTNPDPEVGYLLAYAIAQKKPALLLSRKGRIRKSPLVTFGQRHAIPASLREVFYLPEKLDQILIEFLRELDTIEYVEVPSIKFTLRITPQIERYLYWKTHNTDLSKADFLRNVILDEIIPKDEEFQRYRRKRKDGKTSPDS